MRMRPQAAVIKETKHIALGTLVLSAAMVIVFAVIGHFNFEVLAGALYGSALAIGNFFFLGMTVQRIAESAQGDSPDEIKLAKLRMHRSYLLRMLVGAGLLILGIAVLKLNWIACCCPLVFPRLAILVIHLRGSVRSVKGNGEMK